jgi:hypothetical protein
MYHPDGTTDGHRHHHMSVMQQHVAFFDRNDDGIIYPWETYQGCRALGFNVIMSFVIALIVNGTMSYATLPVSFLPKMIWHGNFNLFHLNFNRLEICDHRRAGYRLLCSRSTSTTSTRASTAATPGPTTTRAGTATSQSVADLLYWYCIFSS